MHLVRQAFRGLAGVATLLVLTCALAGAATPDRRPLIGTTLAAASVPTSSVTTGLLRLVDPATLPCAQSATFEDLDGGAAPGLNYDGIIQSGGVFFAERFVGQTIAYNGTFDAISGAPGSPLTLQPGLPGQNLDVFVYASNTLAGLGHLGFPDMEAIGEGSIAMYFPTPQSQLSLQVVGGNGGAATLDFYRVDGTLIDSVVLTGLAEFTYGFQRVDATADISGVLIQTTDVEGIGLDNVCHEGAVVPTHDMTWGSLKSLYR